MPGWGRTVERPATGEKQRTLERLEARAAPFEGFACGRFAANCSWPGHFFGGTDRGITTPSRHVP